MTTLPYPEHHKISYVLKTEQDNLIGGIIAERLNWGILFISILYVKESFRGFAFGSKLLSEVESEAKKHDCYLAHVDTFDFQAKGFYEKQGYKVFGVLENCPKGHKRYYLQKDL